MDISVIVCTYNRSEITRKMLESMESLIAPQGLTWEILIIDNSTDNTKEVVQGFVDRGRLPLIYMFTAIKNRSMALNRGIKAAKGEILIFIDSDMELDRGYLLAVIAAVKSYPDINVFGGRVLIKWPFPKPSWVIADGPYQNIDSVSAIYDHGDHDKDYLEMHSIPSLGNIFLRKNIFENNLFREDLGPRDGKMGYGEDTEFFSRLKNKGEMMYYIKAALTYHNVEAHKISKKYFLQRKYEMGQYDVKFRSLLGSTIYYFGVPRYLFRKAIKNMFLWIFSINSHKRFFYRLRLWYILGEITGYAKSKCDNPVI